MLAKSVQAVLSQISDSCKKYQAMSGRLCFFPKLISFFDWLEYEGKINADTKSSLDYKSYNLQFMT